MSRKNGVERKTNTVLNGMSAIVLAGGKSSRMGRDKNTVNFDGEPLLLRLIRSLQSVFGEVIIATNQDIPFGIENVKIVRDKVPHLGPLGGISAGLSASSNDVNFVIAVDMPFLSLRVVEHLASAARASLQDAIAQPDENSRSIASEKVTGANTGSEHINGANAGCKNVVYVNTDSKEYSVGNKKLDPDVVVPLTAHGLEPLFAFYNKRCVPVIDTTLARGERKILSAFTMLNVEVIGYNELRELDGADKVFMNINTERDLEEAEAKLGKRADRASGDVIDSTSNASAGNVKDNSNNDTGKEKSNTEDESDSKDIRMPIERATTIFVNSQELVTVQSSLQHVDELACGFLVSEGVLQDRDELESVRVNEERGEVRIRLKRERKIATESMGKRFVTSGCGKGFSFVSLGDAMGMAKVTSDFSVKASEIPILMKEFLQGSGKPGMHSSAVVRNGEIVFSRQDIGRHNTVDMILGKLWIDHDMDRNIMLFTSGRISYEMMVKAGKARIPIVVSRTAATDLAVKLAKRLNIELIGYVRAGNMHLYTDGSRLR
jgi:FdhD protein